MLEQISAIASVVSALAIVASVVYASIQIRQNTRAVRASAYQHVVNSFAEYSFEIARNAELADLSFRGDRDYHSLDEVRISTEVAATAALPKPPTAASGTVRSAPSITWF